MQRKRTEHRVLVLVLTAAVCVVALWSAGQAVQAAQARIAREQTTAVVSADEQQAYDKGYADGVYACEHGQARGGDLDG